MHISIRKYEVNVIILSVWRYRPTISRYSCHLPTRIRSVKLGPTQSMKIVTSRAV